MKNKNTLYPMREGHYKNGLEDLIDYVNKFSNIKEMVMIEIGSYAGESTELFAKNFKKVISIDPYINDYDENDPACQYMDFNEVYNTFSNVISKYNNISHIRKTSDEAINDLKDIKVDLIYIDGLHTYEQVKKDIENYKKIINNYGFISGHDYHPVWQGVIDAIHETIGEPEMKFQDTSWIKKNNI
jgi:hypothetical protein